MTNRERFLAVLNFKTPRDRLPVVEWATWWDKTLDRWHGEGLDPMLAGDALFEAMDLDVMRQFWFPSRGSGCPEPVRHGAAIMEDEDDYERLLPNLYPEHGIDRMLEEMRGLRARHEAGDVAVWFSMDGAFWFPRTLFGIENHLYSFYDYPELYHRIIDDLVDFQIRQMEKIFAILTPEFMTIAEDMSYNNGPMLSEACFQEFLVPYYERVVPFIRERGTKVFVDTDGDVTMMIPWLERMGVQGLLPLERMAGVDVNRIRRDHPDLLLLGAFNKICMKDGEAAMRAEFERLLPAMRSGGYIPGVDHQTPPDVPLETYRVFVRLLREYAQRACEQE